MGVIAEGPNGLMYVPRILKIGPSTIPGCARFKIFAYNGKGEKGCLRGTIEADLPTHTATLAEFISAVGGPKVIRSLAMRQVLVNLRAKVPQGANGKPARAPREID